MIKARSHETTGQVAFMGFVKLKTIDLVKKDKSLNNTFPS